MTADRPPAPWWGWPAGVFAVAAANFVLTLPNLLSLQVFAAGDLGWALTVDALWQDGLTPTVDYAYFYGLLTLVIDRGWFAVFGRTPVALVGLYAACGAAIAAGLVRVAAAARFGAAARVFLLVTTPLAVMPGIYPSPAHALEPALLLNALAFQTAGRPAAALALVTVALFVKPSMAFVYGAVLVAVILAGGGRSAVRGLWPAAAVFVALATLLAAVFGPGPLIATLLPVAGVKGYAAENYGFFFGVGRQFWLPAEITPWYYLLTPAGVWLVMSVLLVVGGVRCLLVGRGPASGAVATCAALHAVFVLILFGNAMSWIYYPYLLVVGAAGVLDRTGLPTRESEPGKGVRRAHTVLICLAGLGQAGTALFMLFAWSAAVRTADTGGLFAPGWNADTWAEVRGFARRERVFVLTDTGCARELFPEVDSPRAWYLIPGVSLPAEVERVREQCRAATWVLLPKHFADKAQAWPELAEELRPFQPVKEYPLYVLLRRGGR